MDVFVDLAQDATTATDLAAALAAARDGRMSGRDLWLALDRHSTVAGHERRVRGRRDGSSLPRIGAQRYLGDEVFMYVGLAVGATWFLQYMSGRWRKPADWIDVMGRFVGGRLWIVIGLVWTLHEYMEFV